MERMCAYIANLGGCNGGELVRAWFTPPVDSGEVKERVGLNNDCEEYAIYGYELPFKIDEYTSIEEINRLCGLAEELEGTSIGEVVSEIQYAFFNSFEEVVEHVNGIVYYPDYNDMEDLAHQMVNEGCSGDALRNFTRYFNYSSFVRDLEIEGNYLVTNRGIFEYST